MVLCEIFNIGLGQVIWTHTKTYCENYKSQMSSKRQLLHNIKIYPCSKLYNVIYII